MKIWFLVGQSNTGKDTIMNRVLNNTVGLSRFVTYTTRDKRENEVNGREYYFKANDDYMQALKDDKVVESRCYHLKDKDVYYYTLKDIDNKKNYIVAGTINQCLSYIKYFGEDVVQPIRIRVNDYERLKRGIEREHSNKENYYEVCRRFCDEFNEYTDKNFSLINFVLDIENNDLDFCCYQISRFIEEKQV